MREPKKVRTEAELIKSCRMLREHNERLKTEIKAIRDWLDNNTTHYLTSETKTPVLAGVAEKIWFHATDDVDSYPFSAVIDKALEQTNEK